MADPYSTTNSLVQGYRKFLQAGGKIDRRPDMALTVELGNILKQQGKFDAQPPDFRDQYLEATQATDRGLLGEVAAGARRGARGLVGTVAGATALGLDAVGADGAAKKVAEAGEEFAAGGEDNAPTIERMADIRNVSGGVRYAAGKIGEAVPSIVESMAAAMIGAAAGTAAAPGAGTAGGAVAGLVGKRAIKELVKRGVAKDILGKEVTEEAVEQAIKAGGNAALASAFVTQGRAVAARMGGAAVGALNSLSLGAGEVYNDTGNVGVSLGAGAISALPDTILPAMLLRRFFPGATTAAQAKEVGGFFSRLAKDAAKTMPIEAGTEAFQELVNIAAGKHSRGEPAQLDAKDYERLREAAASGVAGGFVAAPIGAAASGRTVGQSESPRPNAALEARRRAASGLPPAPPAPPPVREATRGEQLRTSMSLSPDLQDARITALEGFAKRTDAEEQELEVLRALVAQRPKTVATTSPAPANRSTPAAGASVTPPTAPAVGVQPGAVGATAPAAPLVAAPTAPVAPVAPTPAQLSARIRAAGSKLSGLVARVPSLDVGPARTQLDAIAKAKAITDADVSKLEASLAQLETLSVAEAAKIAIAQTAKQEAAIKEKAAKEAAKLKAAADRATAQAEKLAAKEAKKLKPEETPVTPPAPEVPGLVPDANAELVTDAPAVAPVDPLASNLDAALNPPATFDAGQITQDGVVNFQQLAEGLADRGVGMMNEESKAKLRAFDFDGWLKGVLAEKSSKTNRAGLFFDATSGQSKTRTGIALLMPDGRVIVSGLLKGKGLMRVGADPKATAKVTAPAVQRMSERARAGVPKSVEIGGRDPVLFSDLVKFGAVPIDAISFEMQPGEIFQEFPSKEAYDAAIQTTGRAPKSKRMEAGGIVGEGGENIEASTLAEQAAAEQAAQTARPEDPINVRIEEAFGDAPEVWERFEKRVKEHGPALAYSKMPKVGKEQVDQLLKDANATLADLTRYLEDRAATQPAAEALPSAPAPVEQPKIEAPKKAKPKKAMAEIMALAEKLKVEEDSVKRDELTAEITRLYAKVREDESSTVSGPKRGKRFRRDTDAAPTQRVRERFNVLIERLRGNGFDIEILQGELGKAQDAFTDGRTIGIVMEDVANANLKNLVGVIHEAGHLEADKLGDDMRERLSQAVDRTILKVKDGKLVKAASNANLNWEERLVETTAIELAESGFGEQSATLAQAIWRTVKDLYHRVGMALQSALGLEPSDALVLAWWENNMKRRLGGDYDFRFIDLFSSMIERPAARVGRFEVIDGQDIPELMDPLTGELRRAEVMPDTLSAVEWNLNRYRGERTPFAEGEKIRYRKDSDLGVEQDMEYTEAMARVQAASIGELMPVLTKLKAELGSTLTDQQFWKLFGRGDLPKDIISGLETRVPGSGNAAIDGERMTDAMNQRASYQAFALANRMARVNRRSAAMAEEQLAKATDKIVDEARALNKIEREFRDADAMHAVLNDELLNLVKELSADLDRGPNTAFAAGELAGAIRQAERLLPDEAIPVTYQVAFRRILDAGGTSIFDYLSAIAKLDLPLGRMTIIEVIAAIQENAAGDPRLPALVAQRPLMVGLAALARNSTREMNLLQLRTLKDAAQYLAIRAELDEIRTASETRLEEIGKGITASAESKGLSDRLRLEFVKARRKFNATQRQIQAAQEKKLQRTRFAEVMAEKATELSRRVGAFSFWEARNGATYKAMEQGGDGKWTSSDQTLRMIGDDISEQHDRVAHHLASNRQWLQAHKDQAGSRLYEEVRRQTDELSKLDFAKNYEAAHRFWLDKFLQPLGAKFASIGDISGTRIKQMLNQWQTVMFVHSDDVEAAARRWNKALQEASEAAGFTNPKTFFDQVVGDVIYHVESEPGRDETAALSAARKAAKRRIPPSFKVSDSFGEKLGRLLSAHKEVSELLNSIKEKNGVFVGDPHIKDPLTNKANLQRHAIKYGWLTAPRHLFSEVIQTLVLDMKKAGWTDELFTDIDPASAKFEELISKHFTPDIIRTFAEPFINKPGKEVFFGASDEGGRAAPVSQLDTQAAWAESGGDILKFIDGLFDQTNQANDREGLNAYRAAMLRRFRELFTMESNLAAEAGQVPSVFDPDGKKPHRMMDGRTNDLIPPEHFRYDIFAPMDARRSLTDIAYHAAFGRDGAGLDGALTDLKSSMQERARQYFLIPEGSRREKAAFAAEQGWDFKKLERAAEDLKNIAPWEKKLIAHFSNHDTIVGDARAPLEFMQMNMALVLNQPKSALWNLLSLLEFPLVYRGLGKSSVRAAATAAKVFGREVATSFLQAFGASFNRTADYAREIAEVVEKRKSERLPFGTMLSDIGPDGRFASGGLGNRIIQGSRGVQTAMRKGVGAGGFNALWAPFNFISVKADTAIATANVQAFEMVVKRAIDFFEANPQAAADPAFQLTAENLGMAGSAWFSDEGAFKYFRERANDYRVGRIEDVARDAMVRASKGEQLLTRDQALSVAMMGLNEVSLQASINSRPSEMIDNPILRFGGLMLGWPIAKITQVNDAMKSADGRLSVVSMMRAVGVLAAWSLPAGLAYSLMMDEYDEKILDKKSNLRALDPIAITPLIGPIIAAASDSRNILAMSERLARAGSYGLAGDLVNSFVNWVDPTGGQRDFDLNSRVLAYSQFANFRDSIRNIVHQGGEMTYASVGRPLINAMGGGGVIQAMQIVNSAFGLSNEEAAVTNRINVGNWLRAAGRDIGLELRAGAGRSSPTALSVWLQQMQISAMSNDRVGFAEAYRSAVDVARRNGEGDPENAVLTNFKSRHPLTSVYRTKPTEDQMVKLYSAMNDDGRRAVRESLTLFENFTDLIAPNPMIQRLRQQQAAQLRASQPVSIEQLRRRAASGAMGY
jgi:hypothetical protein